jgi:RND family efflux transporter MFP subunit
MLARRAVVYQTFVLVWRSSDTTCRYDRPIDSRSRQCFNHCVDRCRFESRRPQSTSATAPLRIGVVRSALPAVFALLAACSSGKAAAPPPPAGVEVAEVVQRDTPIYSEWVGVLDGYVNAQIQPHVSGYIVRQNYREGSMVARGDVLFEIDPRPFEAALDLANAQLAHAEAQLGKAALDVERDMPLAKERAIAQSQLDTEVQAQLAARALVQAAKANVTQAELNIEWTRVTSLISGLSGLAQVQIGNLVSPSSVLTSVSQTDPIKVYFTVSEQQFMDFHRRFPTQASVEAQRKRIPLQLLLGDGSVYDRTGTISFADREVNPATGAIRIAGIFPNRSNLLRPGNYARIRASVRTHAGALLVPQKAITELQGSQQVAVVTNDKVSIRVVTVGEQVGDSWIVTAGLEPGERVVVEGLQKLRDGAPVKVMPARARSGS